MCSKFSEENYEIVLVQNQQKTFSKDECNVKSTCLIWCREIYGYVVSIVVKLLKYFDHEFMIYNSQHCPKSSWKDSNDCNQGKYFVEKCYTYSDALMKFENKFWARNID